MGHLLDYLRRAAHHLEAPVLAANHMARLPACPLAVMIVVHKPLVVNHHPICLRPAAHGRDRVEGVARVEHPQQVMGIDLAHLVRQLQRALEGLKGLARQVEREVDKNGHLVLAQYLQHA